MPPSIALPIRRLIFASLVATAAGTVACTWSLGYLDNGADGGSSGSSSQLSSSSSSSDPGTGGDAGSAASSSSSAATSSSSSSSPYLGDGGNLIVNPNCQDSVLGWTTLSGTPVESSTVFAYGSDTTSCCAYDRTDPETSGADSGPSYDGPLQDITQEVVAGHTYNIGAWVLWAPPDAGPPGDAGDASTASSDGAAPTGSDASTDAGADASAVVSYPPQNVKITLKQTCGSQPVQYTTLGTAQNVPLETWTQVAGTTLLTATAGCDLEIYVEGPDMGLNLYVDEVSLTLFQ